MLSRSPNQPNEAWILSGQIQLSAPKVGNQEGGACVTSTGPRTLIVDIETSPNIVATFGTRNVNIGLTQIIEPSRVMSVAAKWHGDTEMMFWRGDTEKRRRKMIRAVWGLLDEADAVVHYNGVRFDVPKIRGEAVAYELTPWSPFKQVDLWSTAKQLGYVSSKLDHVLDRLSLDRKLSNDGMALWLACMRGDDAAWENLRAYNEQDVYATEKLYDRLLPWINGLPHHGLYVDNDEALQHCCQRCGSTALTKRGFAYTNLGRYTRYRCKGLSLIHI